MTITIQDMALTTAGAAESKASLSAPKPQELNATCEALKLKLGFASIYISAGNMPPAWLL